MGAAGSQTSPGWAEWLERLARVIPGVTRYQDREGLRETDKQVRVLLADRLGLVSVPWTAFAFIVAACPIAWLAAARGRAA